MKDSEQSSQRDLASAYIEEPHFGTSVHQLLRDFGFPVCEIRQVNAVQIKSDHHLALAAVSEQIEEVLRLHTA